MIVFIESNTTGSGAKMVDHALKQNHQVIFICRDPEKYPFLRDLMVLPVVMDTRQKELILEQLKSQEIHAVISTSEYFIETAAWLSKAFGLPGNDPKAIALCRDKQQCLSLLSDHKFKTPVSYLCSLSHYSSVSQNLKFPVVVKPNQGSGSVDVRLCKTENDLLVLLNDFQKRVPDQRPDQLLFQEYIEGEEISVETIGNGLETHCWGITRKHLFPPPSFVEAGHDFPAPLSTEFSEKIKQAVVSALDILGLNFGPCHTELRLQKDELTFIEVNPRLAGGMIPSLIKESCGQDPLQTWLDLCVTGELPVIPRTTKSTTIRFLMPSESGILIRNAALPEGSKVVDAANYREEGSTVHLRGDFRDRIGHVICRGDTVQQSQNAAISELLKMQEQLQVKKKPDQCTGRLGGGPHPILSNIVNRGHDIDHIKEELEALVVIDQAHLLMLLKQKILPPDVVQPLLATIAYLQGNRFAPLIHQPMPRGIYLAYESYLIERLGMTIAGSLHLGRSRNDINATLIAFKLRKGMQACVESTWKLRSVILEKAKAYQECAMPVYSQFQPAMPGTYAFYLLACELALSRSSNDFMQLITGLNHCPLGAGAGCGSNVAIDSAESAELLGFSVPVSNALDAVAGRDHVLRFVSAMAILGTLLSRIGQDYQIWLTQEFGFFNLPDKLCGGSSMMPQKKNPYLLESIKGKAAKLLGYQTQVFGGMQKVPYANSYEIGTEVIGDLAEAVTECRNGIELLKLVISEAQPVGENMEKSNQQNLTQATALANYLVRENNLSFREAHEKVGYHIRKALALRKNPAIELQKLIPDVKTWSPLQWAQELEYGRGPGKRSVEAMIASARQVLQQHSTEFHRLKAEWRKAGLNRQAAVDAVLNQKGEFL